MEREVRDRNREERERMDELLMQRVTGALSAPEAEALARALTERDTRELKQWDAAAAELTAAMATESRVAADTLPASLADRIVSAGEVMVRTSRAPGSTLSGNPAAAQADATAVRVSPFVAPTGATVSPIRRAAAWSGWLAAAAALIWIVGPGRKSADSDLPQATIAGSGLVGVRGAQLRDSLLEADSLLLRLAWGTTGDSSAIGATGDVVWSGRSQRGVMRIAGLKPNDRARWQYQLWIFDKKRDQRYPVDGGVFDIPPGSHEVFVPIDARLPVGEAVMFAVTVEPAGGVVVSTRERIALLAKQAG